MSLDLSTFQAAQAAAATYADWEATGDIASARNYLSALNAMIVLGPTEMAKGSERVRLDQSIQAWQKQIDRVSSWLIANNTAAVNVTYLSVENFRGAGA